MAQGGAEWVAESAVEETRLKAERTESAGGESAQAGAREHSPGEGTREGAPDHRRPGKSCRAAGIEPRGRDELLKAAEALATYVGVKPACDALRVARATFYRRRGPSTGHQQPRPTPARALSEKERDKVFDTLCSERFVDRSPAEVVATGPPGRALGTRRLPRASRAPQRPERTPVPADPGPLGRPAAHGRRHLQARPEVRLGGRHPHGAHRPRPPGHRRHQRPRARGRHRPRPGLARPRQRQHHPALRPARPPARGQPHVPG